MNKIAVLGLGKVGTLVGILLSDQVQRGMLDEWRSATDARAIQVLGY